MCMCTVEMNTEILHGVQPAGQRLTVQPSWLVATIDEPHMPIAVVKLTNELRNSHSPIFSISFCTLPFSRSIIFGDFFFFYSMIALM